VLVALCSCGDGAPFVGYVSRSQFFEYHDEVDEPLCPSLLDLLDEHARSVGGTIGLTLDASRPFRYYKFRDETKFASSQDAGGKAFGDYLFSPHYFEAHEQAHVYTFRAWGGWSTPWLNEGEAVALSCDPTKDPTPNTAPRALLRLTDWREQLYGSLTTPEGYAAAGFLVAHLARQYGWERVGDLHRKVPQGTSQVDLERAFAQVFPISMDQAWFEALDTPGAPACDPTWTCRATPLDVGKHVQLDCDGRLHRSVDVGAGEAGLVIDVSDDSGVTLSGRCADRSAGWYPLPGTASGSPATHWALVPPGSYTVFAGASDTYVPPARPAWVSDGAFTPRARAPADLGLRARLPAGFVGASCGAAGTVSLESSATTYVDIVRAYDDAWLRVDGGGRSFGVVAQMLFTPFGVSQPLEICAGCGAGAACTPIPARDVTLDGETVVHMQGVSPDRPPVAGQLVFFPTLSANAGR